MKIRGEINGFNDYVNELKNQETSILNELDLENTEIKDCILKLRILGDAVNELDGKFNIFYEENKEIIRREILSDYNIVRQEIINLDSRISINYNTFVTMEKIREQQEKLEIQTERVENHDKNMLNIMGAFLALFSLIGVNFSFFSNFTGGRLRTWIFLIVAVNLSLIFTIVIIFICIKLLFLKDFSWLHKKKEK